MFEDFARVWTPVVMASELGRAAPLGVQVAGTPVVLFRDKAGKPAALVDRCPHRGVKLSLGKLKDGRVECPFHGWQLDCTGQVCHVPWNPDAKTANLRGTPVPVRELAGQIWIFTAIEESPPAEPELNEMFLRNDVRISGFSIEWDAHWTRAMENMLDWPHLPFVHTASIGKDMLPFLGGRMDINMEERPWGHHTNVTINGKANPVGLDFRWPNLMHLLISLPKKNMVLQTVSIPVDFKRTRVLFVTARDFMKSKMFDPLFHRMNRKVAAEDKPVIESSFPVEVPPGSEERSVRTDAPTLAFRKRYYAELRGTSSGAAAPSAPRGVVLPLAS